MKGSKVTSLRKIVGKNIKRIRKLKKWTQAELAEKIGIEPVSVARIETGLNFPKEENLTAIARNLNVEVSDLFVDRDNDKKTMLQYIQGTLNSLNKRDLEIISNLLKTMTCC